MLNLFKIKSWKVGLFSSLFSLMGHMAVAQHIIQGKIVGEDSLALAGVSVMQDGSTKGTLTDESGHFSLIISDHSRRLEFTHVGYKDTTIRTEASPVFLVMERSASSLDDVVIVGYGVQKKENLTAAISTLSSEDLSRTTSSTTAGALVGKVAGLTYRQSSGVPGAAATIQIRNMGSPLYVIDGVMEDGGQFNNIDLNDIESVTVLKDGAAAIYGVKAANGVILVTTKSGKYGHRPTVTANSYYGWQQWFRYPRLLNAYEWEYANIMRDVNTGVYSGDTAQDAAMLDKWKAGYYNSATGEDYRGYDWKKNYVNNAAPLFYKNVSVTGGSDKVTYYLSMGNVDQDAVFKDYKFQRTNMAASLEAKISPRFKLGMKLNGRIEDRENPGMPGTDDYEAARAAVVGLAPIYRPYANDNPEYLNAIPNHYGGNLAAINDATAGTYSDKWYVLESNWYSEYITPLKGLIIKGLYSFSVKDDVIDNFEKGWQEYSYNASAQNYNLVYDKSAAGDTYLYKARNTTTNQLGQLTFNYDSTFGGVHHFSAVVGIESNKNSAKVLSVQQNPINSNFISLINTDPKNTVGDYDQTTSTLAYIFRLGYDYKAKYLISALARYDGSWKFPKNNRWGFFPSVQAAWHLSRENFFANKAIAKVLSNVKFRVSYGELGDDNLGGLYPDFAYLPGYNYNAGSALISPYPDQDVTGQKITGLQYKGVPITTLSWMKSKITDIGVDLGFFNDKLTVTTDIFKRLRSGIPAVPSDVMIPVETGLTVLPLNLDGDEILGIEGSVDWSDYSKKFKYEISANVTLARQRFTARSGEKFFNSWDQYRYSQKDRWGNVYGGSQMWMWDVIGVFKTQAQIDAYHVDIDGQNNATVKPGDLIFKDVNKDGVIDDYDRRPLGYAGGSLPWDDSYGNKLPLLTTGLTLKFQYANMDLGMDLEGGFMNTFVMDWNMKWGVNRTTNAYYYNSIDVWHHEDIFDPSSPWVPGNFPSIGTTSNRGENNFYTTNVNYVRLRNITFGYSLPPKLCDAVRLSKIRFYAQGTNLLSVDNLSKFGLDPEITRVDGEDYPQQRVYTVGLQITF